MTHTPSPDNGADNADRPAGGRDLIRRLVRQYLAHYKLNIAIGVVCMILVAATTAANAWLAEPVLDEIFLNRNRDLLVVLPVVVIALAVVKALATFGKSYLIEGVAVRISADVQNQLYAHLMRADLKFFHGVSSGRLISSFLTDAMQLREAAGKALNRNRDLLVVLPVVVIALAVVKALATFGKSYLIEGVAVRISADVQNQLYAHLMRADLKFFHGVSSGRLISSFLTDAMQLREAAGKALIGLVKDSLTLAFLIAVMFEKDWRLALIVAAVLPLAAFPLRRTGRRMRKSSAQVQALSGALAAHLDTTFDGARDVKAYGMEGFETARARAAIRSREKALLKTIRIRAAASPLMEMLAGIAIALVIWYGGNRVIAGITTPGAFFAFITALLLSYQPLKALANLNAALQSGLAAADRLFAALDRLPEIADAPGARPLAVQGGEITFDAVDFAYRPEIPALAQVSFSVPAGRTVALVGPSGAGKSTILNLIPRFFDVDRGSVSIDGIDIRQATIGSLRRAIGLVAQDATLFDDTVRANIAYGRADATDAEVAAAAEAAGAHDFVTALPNGYDTEVGTRGVRLSGGQRQRIAIARAMLKNAPILLLDEATSALDSESERLVQAALTQLMAGRTTLVVAHRLSTVLHADRILVIEDGRIVESGRHDELVARGGRYARLHATQFAPPTEAPGDTETAPPADGRRAEAGG